MKPFENLGRSNGNGHALATERRPGDIEEEIEITRARMQSTLEAIKKDLSPGQMVDQVLHSVREGRAHDVATSAMHSVGDMVKANPLPAAVIGIGIVWLAASNRDRGKAPTQRELDLQPRDIESEVSSFDTGASLDTSSDTSSSREGESRMEHAKDRASHLASGARAKVHGARAKVSGAAHGAASRAKSAAHTASSKATSGALRARDATVRTYGEQPLVIGAIAVGVGALLGALLPATKREDELLGAQRDRVKQRVDEASAEMLGRVKQKVDEGAQRMHAKLDEASASAQAPSKAPSAEASAMSTPPPQSDDGDFGGP